MISFAYFDLGGVIEKDFSGSSKWEDLLDELGIDIAYRDVFADFWKDKERELCTTQDTELLIPLIQEKFGAKIPSGYSFLDGFVKRFEKNESIWPVLEKIQKTTRIGLLTNQYPHMLDAIKKRDILPPIHLDVIVDSSEVGFIKPDKEIYAIAQEKAGVLGNETFFVDNNEWAVDAAKDFGWQAFFYDAHDYEASSKDLLRYWESLQ